MVVNQFWPWITETLEDAEKQQQARENETKTKLEEEKYSLEFSNSIENEVDEKLSFIDEELVNKDEKEQIIKKLKAVYINNKSKNIDFNSDQEILKIIDTSSFESMGQANDYESFNEYNKKVKEIREEVKMQYSTEITDNENNDFWATWIEENSDIEISPEETIKNLENMLESKNNLEYPILKWLHDNQQIDSETYSNILENLAKNPETKVKEIITKTPIENPETKEELDRVFNESTPQKNIENFNKTLKEYQIEWTEELIDVVDNKSNDTIYQEIHNLIWSNFLQIDKQWNNPEKNLQIAIQTAWNKVLDKYPSINKMSDTQAFKNAFIDIKSWNVKNWIEWIKNLLLLWSTIAFAWKKLNKEHMQKAKWLIEKKYKDRIKKIEEDIVKLNEEIKENKEKLQENTDKIEKLQKEKKEITNWELFQKAWKIDKNSEAKEKQQD